MITAINATKNYMERKRNSMRSKLYEVYDNEVKIASGMDLETALLLMRAYCETYYHNSVDLKLVEMEKVSCGNE